MQVYQQGCDQITIGKTTYVADERGIITFPDSEVNSSVWSSGFVSAKGRIAELAAEQSAKPVIAEVIATPVETKPAAKNSDKATQ